MNDSDILPALIEIINSKPPTNIIDDILQSLEKEINKQDQPELDIASIASCLHQIYISTSPDVRAAVIYFCRRLEEYSSNKITEKYMFDNLISQSLGQKIPIDIDNSTDYQLTIDSSSLASSGHIRLNRKNSQVTSLQNFRKIHHIFNRYNDFSIQDNTSGIMDKEKLACLKYIELLIFQEGGHLSSSIVRALVSLYESKYQWHKECKVAVLDILVQASINFTEDQKYLMPSVLGVFSSYLFEDSNNMTIPALFAYSIENNLPLIYDDLVLMDFFLPLSNYSIFMKNTNSSESNVDIGQSSRKNELQIDDFGVDLNAKIENAQQALIYFLRTWPGLLYFGIKNKAIEHLMICMPYKPKVVISILKSLLGLKENTSSVTDGYSGFLLAELLKLGFIEKLNQECSTISQNQGFPTNETLKAVKTVENTFSLFSHKLTSLQFNSHLDEENNEIIEKCESFINELLPFTSHCSTGDSLPNKPVIKPNLEKKAVSKSVKRGSFLNSDSDLEFNNMSCLMNLTGDEYSSSVSSKPMNNASFTLNFDDTFSRMIDVAQVIMHKSKINSVSDVLGKKKDFNYKTIKWTEIQILLTVVLPYDQSEAKESSKLYTSMINFLSSNDFSSASMAKRIEMYEPYSSLFDLLLNGKLEENYIEDNMKFKELIKSTIKDITHAKTVANLSSRGKNSSNNSRKNSAKSSPIAQNFYSSTTAISPPINDKGCFDMNSSKWFIFRLLMKIMSNKKGIEILHKWKIGHKIVQMGKKISNSQVADAILGEILFYPDSSLSVPTFLNFLSSYDSNIHKSALSQLRILRTKLSNFNEICFKPILIQHIKEITAKTTSLFSSLNLLGEIISTDEASLITVCEDIELIRIIFNNSHPIFSLLLSREETKKTWNMAKTSSKNNSPAKSNKSEKNIPLIDNFDSSSDSNSSSFIQPKTDRKGRRISKEDIHASFSSIDFDEIVDREIRYWMDLGNLTYYLSFNSAVDAMFSDTLEEAIKKQPAIFLINGCAQPPPHLFGQLSKLKEGLEKLTPYIQELVNILVSLIDNPNFCFPSKNVNIDQDNKNENNERVNYRATFQIENNLLRETKTLPNITSPNSANVKLKPPKRSGSSKITKPRVRQGSNRHAEDENVCGIFFALAQLGSVPSSSQIVEELGIVEKMIQAAVASSSYIIKGALISALSLFAPSDYLSSVLQRYKWQKFRFGNRSCIIPRKPRSLFRETAVKKLNVITAAASEEISVGSSSEYQVPPIPKIPVSKIPIPKMVHNQMSIQQKLLVPLKTSKSNRPPSASFDQTLIAALGIGEGNIEEDSANLLVSVAFDPKCLKKLLQNDKDYKDSFDNQTSSDIIFAAAELENKIGKEKINTNLKIWANKLMASYKIENDARDLLNYLFNDIPLMEMPQMRENKIEDKIEITSKFNQIYASSKGLFNDKKFKHVKPFNSSIDEIKKLKIPFPEASLTEKEFKEIASISIKDFYELDDDKKEKIRSMFRNP